jgi:hypothetical protein
MHDRIEGMPSELPNPKRAVIRQFNRHAPPKVSTAM